MPCPENWAGLAFSPVRKLEAAPAHPLQCRGPGKDSFPDSQRTASVKADAGGLEAEQFRPNGLALIRGSAYGCSSPLPLLPFPVKRDACPLASRQ